MADHVTSCCKSHQRGGMANSSQGAGVTREQGKFCDHTNKMYRYYVTQLFISVMQIEKYE